VLYYRQVSKHNKILRQPYNHVESANYSSAHVSAFFESFRCSLGYSIVSPKYFPVASFDHYRVTILAEVLEPMRTICLQLFILGR